MNQPQLHVGRGAPEPTALCKLYDVRPLQADSLPELQALARGYRWRAVPSCSAWASLLLTADHPPSLRAHWPRDTIAAQRADLIAHLTARAELNGLTLVNAPSSTLPS